MGVLFFDSRFVPARAWWAFEARPSTTQIAIEWDYTLKMDSVRFGRVLGVGARLAGKTLVEAVDAATSPDPSAQSPPRATGNHIDSVSSRAPAQGVILPARKAGARTANQVRATSQGVRRGGMRFGEAMWGPVARASGVLWLEVTGLFFGLVALLGLDGMWVNRAALHWMASGHDVHLRFLIAVGMAAVFGYFGASSFVRAARRGLPLR